MPKARAIVLKAVILAAGAGSRMGSPTATASIAALTTTASVAAFTATTPKPLLPIDGRDSSCTFLDWHLRCLTAAGVAEIHVVGSPRVVAMATVAAEWIVNPLPAGDSGSAYSTWLAWQSPARILDGRSRVLLMDADIVYDPRLLTELVAEDDPCSKTLVATAHRETGEEVLVFASPDRPDVPVRHGKGLAGNPIVAGLRCLGEATGITLWEPADHALLAERTSWVVHHSPAGARSEHEDVTQEMMLRGRVRAVRFGTERAFFEVDTPEDYGVLIAEIAPILLART